MEALTAKITSKGQVTLPKVLRETLALRQGDRVAFTIDSEGHASLERVAEKSTSEGILSHLAKGRPVTVEEMDEAIGEAVSERFGQSIEA